MPPYIDSEALPTPNEEGKSNGWRAKLLPLGVGIGILGSAPFFFSNFAENDLDEASPSMPPTPAATSPEDAPSHSVPENEKEDLEGENPASHSESRNHR